MVFLFADDGVVMLQGAPSITGKASLRSGYCGLFRTLHFDLVFTVAGVVRISSELAFVRTTSQGTVKNLTNDTKVSPAGQELFLIERRESGWKIAHYAAIDPIDGIMVSNLVLPILLRP